jgi:peptide/nickel transport system permease protein
MQTASGTNSNTPAAQQPIIQPRRPRHAITKIFLKNRLILSGLIIFMIMVIQAVGAGWISPHNPLKQNYRETLQAPSWKHPFGTDRFGRDILSRQIYGARISLRVALISISMAMVVGGLFGLFAGYFGGWIDLLISRLMDVFFSFPAMFLAIALAAMMGNGEGNAIIAIAIVYMPLFARILRGSVLAEREQEYVTASMALGAKTVRIIFSHILPNVISPTIVQAAICMSYAIIIEAALSFLGLGIQPPTPSWGTMLNEGRTYLEIAPWMSIFPGLAIMFAVLSLNLMSDGFRDVLDPRSRRRPGAPK